MNTTHLRFRSNRVGDIVRLFHEELDGLYGSGEVGVFVEMLLEAFLGWDKVRVLTAKAETINQSDLLRFHWALEDLKQQRPIQHIIGYTDFCGCRIAVNPDVLIPRPETEEMVQWVIEWASPIHLPQSSIFNFQFSILDLCTGSGCIAIALKKAFPQANVSAVDISEAALETARRNADENNVEIHFIQADLLYPQLAPQSRRPQFTIHNSQLAPQAGSTSWLHKLAPQAGSTSSPTSVRRPQFADLSSQFTIIISNPPYIRNSERAQMRRNVLDFDPEQALFVPDDDPLCFYRSIAAIANRQLTEDGLLVVEINEALGDATCATLRSYGLEPELHRDFRGRWRWITACRVNR